MRLPRKYRLINVLILLILIVITGSTSLTTYLPKDLQKLLPPTPTLVPTNLPPLVPTVAISLPDSPPNQALQTAKVIRVTDGDTIVLEGGIKLRYIGINAPESVDPRRPIECFGENASKRNKELIEGKTVLLEKDVNETDRYARLLRYVYVGETMINEQLVREGYAVATAYPPDIKYQNKLEAAEQYARENRLGLWATCNKDKP